MENHFEDDANMGNSAECAPKTTNKNLWYVLLILIFIFVILLNLYIVVNILPWFTFLQDPYIPWNDPAHMP